MAVDDPVTGERVGGEDVGDALAACGLGGGDGDVIDEGEAGALGGDGEDSVSTWPWSWMSLVPAS